MALGATPSLVSRLFLGKAVLVGAVGGAIGYGFGTALAVGFGPYWTGVAVGPVPSLAAMAVVVAAAVSLPASYLPARRLLIHAFVFVRSELCIDYRKPQRRIATRRAKW